MTYCLDTWAVVEWMRNREPAAGRLDDLVPSRPLMSWINVGEVFSIVSRERGRGAAVGAVETLRRQLALDPATPARVLEAAAIKAAHRVSYADAFAVATALAHDAVLLTGDPEILAGDPAWRTEDLRAA